MPTPRERANAVVGAWLAAHPFLYEAPTPTFTALAESIAKAIDAQVADWMASQPAPNGWGKVAKASHVVEHEPEKDYTRPMNATGSVAEALATAAEFKEAAASVALDGETQTLPTCRHVRTRWDKENRYLICGDCGQELPKGTCIRCGRPAVSNESFSCGEACG